MIIALGVVAYLISWVIAARIMKRYLLADVYDNIDIKNNTAPPGSMKPTSWCLWMGFIWPFTILIFLLLYLMTSSVWGRFRNALIRIVLGRTK